MSILDKIFATKQQEVEAEMALTSEAELVAQVRDLPPTRGFTRFLLEFEGTALIAEIKRSSPSKGRIREDFDAEAIARTYEASGAQAISVLTDKMYFEGDPSFLTLASRATSLPTLRKDFVFHRYQLLQARAWGGDAALLIAAYLSPQQLSELHAFGASLGLDLLVEVHNEAEAEVAAAGGYPLVGINNRDLTTFSTSLETTTRLAPLLQGTQVIVSESAIESLEDVQKVCEAGAKAVLIGTTFTASADIGAKVREVMGR